MLWAAHYTGPMFALSMSTALRVSVLKLLIGSPSSTCNNGQQQQIKRSRLRAAIQRSAISVRLQNIAAAAVADADHNPTDGFGKARNFHFLSHVMCLVLEWFFKINFNTGMSLTPAEQPMDNHNNYDENNEHKQSADERDAAINLSTDRTAVSTELIVEFHRGCTTYNFVENCDDESTKIKTCAHFVQEQIEEDVISVHL